MRSLSIRGVAGNAKLRGKKVKLCRCGCCVITNFKNEEVKKEKLNEIKGFSKGELS